MGNNLDFINDQAKWQFTDWFQLNMSEISKRASELNRPGVYEIAVPFEFGRIIGTSNVIYVGRASRQKDADKGTLASSLRRHVVNGCPVEKKFRAIKPEALLLSRYAIAGSEAIAGLWEHLRFRFYIEQNWELPPGNRRGLDKDDAFELQELGEWINKMKTKFKAET